MVNARKKAGPTVATAEKVGFAGCANSVSPTLHVKVGTGQYPEFQSKKKKKLFVSHDFIKEKKEICVSKAIST